MKTLFLRNFDSTVRVGIKADIFATNAELQTPGFETRFTNMTLENYDNAAKIIFNIQEVEDSWQGIIALAQATAGIGLFLTDKNESIDATKVAQIDSVALAGTSGTANVTVDGVDYLATFTTNISTSADNFVTSHAAALSTAGITVTHPNADGVLVFTADVDGVAFYISVVSNVSGDLAGVIANVTLNQSGGGEITIVAP